MRRLSVRFSIAAAVAALAACTAAETSAPTQEAARPVSVTLSDEDDDGRTLKCAPLAAAYGEALIGPAGGQIVVGPHRFTVPAGALSAPVLITARVQPDSLVAVKFGPSGLVFAEKAKLELSTAHCAAAQLPSTSLLIAHVTDDGTRVVEQLSSNEQPGGIWAEIEHFTRYAIAY